MVQNKKKELQEMLYHYWSNIVFARVYLRSATVKLQSTFEMQQCNNTEISRNFYSLLFKIKEFCACHCHVTEKLMI